MAINIYLRVPVSLPLPQLAEFAKKCEDAGFAGIGIHDHQDAGRDVFLALTTVALNTSSLKLFPAVTNPITRHPMVLASIANSLGEVAPNRTLMMIATGDMAVSHLGRPKATVKELGEATATINQLLAGKSLAERKEFMDMTEEVQDASGHIIRKLKPRRRSENYSSFNDFFVTISTLTTEDGSS